MSLPVVRRREDLPKGRGGLDLYPRNWMQAPSYIPDGNYAMDSKLYRVNSGPHVGLAGFGRLGASTDLTVPVDEAGMESFSSYWQTVKTFISDFETSIGYKISLKIDQMGQMRQALIQQGGMDSLITALDGDIATVNVDLQNYWQAKGYIDQFQSVWQSAASAIGLAGLRGLGIIPLVAIVTGEVLAAIAFVALVGYALYQKYKNQTYVLDQLASPNLTPDARASLQQVATTTTNGGVLDSVGSTITSTVQYLAIGVLLYFGYKAYKNS